MLRRWRARDLLIRKLEELAVLGICLLGSAVLLVRVSQAWMAPSSWHPVVAMDPFVAHAKPARPVAVAIAPQPMPAPVVRVAIHPPIYGPAARRQAQKKKTLALVLLATVAHQNAAARPATSAGGSGSADTDSATQPARAARTLQTDSAAAARGTELAASAALATGRALVQAFDATVAFVSERLIPDGDLSNSVKGMLDTFSARVQSLGSSSGFDLNSLGDFSGASVLLVIMAFLAALALCLLGPLYLSSRSERVSHAHFFRLEGRR
jgi:hypothetical protein